MGSKAAARLVLAVLVGAMAISIMVSTGASAQMRDPYGNGKPTVLPTRITNTAHPEPSEEPTVLGERIVDGPGDRVAGAADEPQPGVLPLTGGQVVLFGLAGLGLMATGTLIVRRNRGLEKQNS